MLSASKMEGTLSLKYVARINYPVHFLMPKNATDSLTEYGINPPEMPGHCLMSRASGGSSF